MTIGEHIRGVRVQSALAMLLGVAGGYYAYYVPLEAAKHHLPVQYYSKFALAVPLLVLFGGYFCVFGRNGIEWMMTMSEGTRRVTKFGWIVGTLLLLASIGIAGWLRSTLESYGYALP